MKTQLIILGITLCAACKHDTPVSQPLPASDAAQVIAGTYTANLARIPTVKPYPINGRTIRFQIERLSPDRVRVKVQAPANGFYSPTRDTTYDNVYVLTRAQGYYLTLETDATQPSNQLGSELVIAPPVPPATSPNWASYVFVPPGYQLGRVSAEFTKDK